VNSQIIDLARRTRARTVLAAAFAIALTASVLPTSAGHVRAAGVNSLAMRATYDVVATFNWDNRHVQVSTTAHVTNPTGSAVSTLAFNITPFRQGNASLGAVTVNGAPASAHKDDQTALVDLSPALPSGGSATVRIDYTATLNATASGEHYLFARADGVMGAYRWVPFLTRQTRYDRPSVGDPWVTASSPLVNVTITTDRALKFAATGVRKSVSANGLTQKFTARNVRDFNFSAAPDYRTSSRTTNNTRITFFYRTMAPAKVLDWAVKAVKDYSSKVGTRPYGQVNIGEVGPVAQWAAIESPGHFWLPRGTAARLIPWTVTHEMAHQWFYAAVGNDQAEEPFADEALADFMSRNLIDSWISSPCAEDDLDQSVYDLAGCYPWVIYVQGNLYLKKYRDTVGSTAFWRGLANYYSANKFKIGHTREILDALDNAAGISYPHWQRFPSLY
jgi:hypothetical protein